MGKRGMHCRLSAATPSGRVCTLLSVLFLLLLHTGHVNSQQEVGVRPRLNETWADHIQWLCNINQTNPRPACCASLATLQPVVYALGPANEIMDTNPLNRPQNVAKETRYVVLPKIYGAEVAQRISAYRTTGDGQEPITMGVEGLPRLEKAVMWNVLAKRAHGDFVQEMVKAIQEVVCLRANSSSSSYLAVVVENIGWRAMDLLYASGSTNINATQNPTSGTQPQSSELPPSNPDVVLVRHTDAPLLQWRGLLRDLSPLLQDEYYRPSRDTIWDDIQLGRVYHYARTHFKLGPEEWYALPLISNTMVALFNRTTFAALNYTMPADLRFDNTITTFSNSFWNWRSLTTTIGPAIKNYLRQTLGMAGAYPMVFEPGYSDELNLLGSLGSSFFRISLGAEKNYTDTICSLNTSSTGFGHLAALLAADGLVDPTNLLPAQDSNYQKWKESFPTSLDSTNAVPLAPYPNHDLDEQGDVPILGWALSSMEKPWPQKGRADIGVTLMPELRHLLSAYGLAIPANSRNPKAGWDLMRTYVLMSRPYLSGVNMALDGVPPYWAAISMHPWRNLIPQYSLYKIMTNYAVPISHPYGQPPEFSQLQEAKPLRHLLATMALNTTAQSGIALSRDDLKDRMCAITNRIFLRPCQYNTHLRWTISECDPKTNTLTVTYSWQQYNSTHLACRTDDIPLPPTDTLTCHYPADQSPVARELLGVSVAGIVYVVAIAVVVAVFRHRKVIKSASPTFCLIMLTGCGLMYGSIILFAGYPTRPRMLAAFWVFFLGWVLLFGSLLCKLYRIHHCFRSLRLHAAVRLTDTRLLVPLCVLVVVEACLLLWLSLTEHLGVVDTSDTHIVRVSGRGVSLLDVVYEQAQARIAGAAMACLLGFNLLLVAAACLMSFRLYRVPSEYQESKLILVTVYSLALCALVAAPLLAGNPSQVFCYRLVAGCVAVALFLATTAFFVPKMLALSGLSALNVLGSQSTSRTSTPKSQWARTIATTTGRLVGSHKKSGSNHRTSGNGSKKTNANESRTQVEATSTQHMTLASKSSMGSIGATEAGDGETGVPGGTGGRISIGDMLGQIATWEEEERKMKDELAVLSKELAGLEEELRAHGNGHMGRGETAPVHV
eukprot:comp22751_c0_seq1/m.35495 comp22751_c0_seq1/g.35495  ORF comp22751_c0_seq1/g.35495 comp22751_c0_seq1/m.35495 type:complete len:1118 (-) comp22751_c0_seq1:9-3362(-)